MQTINSLVTLQNLEDLASRSNFRAGKAIAEDAEISFEKKNSFNVIAKIKYSGGEGRTVQMSSTPKGLKWKCTCTNRKNIFCKHCVAACLAIIR